jgi:predicted ArsR family transcriptional regulator
LLIYAIKDRGIATTAELSAAAYLSPNATRRHLHLLVEGGFVAVRSGNGKRGRPAHSFSLTAQGEATFPEDYFEVADALLSAAKSQTPEIYHRLEQGLLEARLAAVSTRLAGLSGIERVREYEGLLHEEGYYPRVIEREDGAIELELVHCPIIRLAQRHPELCALELTALAEIIGPGVTRTSYRLVDGRTCAYLIRFEAVSQGD